MDAPKIMSLHSIKEITHDFSPDQELGSGKYGTVYKGVQNGVEVAVKMLQYTPGVDDCEQFKKEFENLRNLRHRNIVQLRGYCYEIKREYVDSGNGRFVFADHIYRALSFEYMQKGNLREYISEEFDGLDWQTRYKIIKGVCEGLKYLHEEVEIPIYHLDLKPENILLDKNMMPKLADFGLSRLVVNEQTGATESAVGTTGYIPPEYIEEKFISKKFDIFSLGVVMIKIMAGHEGYNKKSEMSSQEFIDLVHKNWRNRLQAVTPGCTSLELEDACNQVKRCIEIASNCVSTDRKQRPEIGTIVHWLNETELMVKEMGLCLPPESTNDQRRHIEKEVQPMDVSTAPSPFQRTSVPKGLGLGLGLQESSSAEVTYNSNYMLRRAHLSGSNPGVQPAQLLGSHPGVVNPLQKVQPGGDTGRGQPKKDASDNGKGQKDGARSSDGGEVGGENQKMVPPHPTGQLQQQMQMKEVKLRPPPPPPPADGFFDHLSVPNFFVYPEMVLDPTAMSPGANGGGEGQPKDAGGNGKGQKDGARSSFGGAGGRRNTNMVAPMQMKELKRKPPIPPPLTPPPQLKFTFSEYEDDSESYDDSDNDSIPNFYDDPRVVLELEPKAMPPDAKRGEKNGGNVGSKKSSGRMERAASKGYVGRKKGSGNEGSEKNGGVKQNNSSGGGGGGKHVGSRLPKIISITHSVNDPLEGMLPQQMGMVRPSLTDGGAYPGMRQIGSMSGMPPMTHLHFHMGNMQVAGIPFQGGAAGLEMLQAAAATGNPMAQQQYMALMQWQLQQQMITGGRAQGHDGAVRRRRPFSCVLSCFCCA